MHGRSLNDAFDIHLFCPWDAFVSQMYWCKIGHFCVDNMEMFWNFRKHVIRLHHTFEIACTAKRFYFLKRYLCFVFPIQISKHSDIKISFLETQNDLKYHLKHLEKCLKLSEFVFEIKNLPMRWDELKLNSKGKQEFHQKLT